MDLSIVIPVYNEADKIGQDITAAGDYLNEAGYAGEIIVIDDGSQDTTTEIVQTVHQAPSIPVQLIQHPQNQGKGSAIRSGVLAAQGDMILFADCGTCIPYTQAERGITLLRNGDCDIAIGSRHSQDSHIVKSHSLYRRCCSHLFRITLRLLLPELRYLDDTQCGFKVYNGPLARDLFQQIQINGFMFDIEVLALALSQGHKICQFPVTWTCDRDSRLSPTHSAGGIVSDLFKIRRERRT
ncbi:glycosyltransferase [Planctomycetota bacterium]